MEKARNDSTNEIITNIVGSDIASVLGDPQDGNTKDAGSAYVHKFSRPISYDGKTYTEMTFAFGDLTGGDSLDVEAELTALNHPVLVRSIDSQYLIRICARACTDKVGSDIFRKMPLADYTKITNAAKRFL